MSNVFTLEALHKEISKKYGPFHFQANGQEFVLNPVALLPKAQRKLAHARLEDLQHSEEKAKALNEVRAEDEPEIDSEDVAIAAIKGMIEVVLSRGDKESLFYALKDENGDDSLVTLMAFLNAYSERTQPGEASGSES